MKDYQFNALDFCQISKKLSPKEQEHLVKLKSFLKELQPEIYKDFNLGRSPKNFLKQLGQERLLGCSLNFNDSNKLSDLFYGLMLFHIESLDSGLRSLVSVHSSLAMYAIYRYAPDKIKSAILNDLQQNKQTACFALTEPKHGSDPSSMECAVTYKNGTAYLQGEKHWVTNAQDSQVMVVWFKDKDQYKGAFINPQSPQVKIKAMPEQMSLRTSPSFHVTFEQLEIPKENFLEVEGLRGPLSCLNNARWGVAWGALGAANACFEEALQYTKERQQFGKPLCQNQMIQDKLSSMFAQIQLSLVYMKSITEMKQEKAMTPQHVSLAKMHHVSEALNIARQARDLLGGIGVTQKFSTFRHMVNLESVNTYEGTQNIHKLILGQYLSGQPAF